MLGFNPFHLQTIVVFHLFTLPTFDSNVYGAGVICISNTQMYCVGTRWNKNIGRGLKSKDLCNTCNCSIKDWKKYELNDVRKLKVSELITLARQ